MAEKVSVTATAVKAPAVVTTDDMQRITERIRQEAHRLLQGGAVDVVIGCEQGWNDAVATPCFLTDAAQVDRLIFNELCSYNLAKFLVGREGYLTSRFRSRDEKPRVAVVARPATMRTVVGLIQEHQFEREDLIVLGITDGTPIGIEPDVEVGQIPVDAERQERILAQMEQLENMSAAERWDWWEREFAKCIRCYACRQVCPFCYCEQCIADENQPQWIGKSPSLMNNRIWNTIRAFHLVGRCIDCGECDRVCPVRIPLAVLNNKMAAEVEEAFGFVAGTNAETAALFTFRPDDPDDFIR